MDAVRGSGRRGGRRRKAGVAGLLAASGAVAVAALGHAGSFSRFVAPGPAAATPLPGATVEPDPTDAAPVVTSLRSNGEAERRGVRVGDRIAAVDGQPVPDMTALRAAVARHAGPVPVALDIRRGDVGWTVALNSAEPALDQP